VSGAIRAPNLCSAIQRHRQNAGNRGFSDPPVAREDVSMRNPVLGQCVQKGACNVVLPGYVGKPLRTIFASQNLITHAINYSQVRVISLTAPGWIVSFLG